MIDAKKKVNLALAQYFQGIDQFNSGWNILRYAQQGLLDTGNPAFRKDFAVAFNQHELVILRLAKAGKLSYIGPNAD